MLIVGHNVSVPEPHLSIRPRGFFSAGVASGRFAVSEIVDSHEMTRRATVTGDFRDVLPIPSLFRDACGGKTAEPVSSARVNKRSDVTSSPAALHEPFKLT